MKSYSSAYGSRNAVRWTPLALIDDQDTFGWSSAKGKVFPHSLVFELPATHLLKSLLFKNKTTAKHTKGGHAAKLITVSVSTTTADGPYVPIVQGEIPTDDDTDVALKQAATARWVKLDITGNAGIAQYTALMEFSAFGTPVTQRDYNKSYQGTYMTNWGNFYLSANGTELRGCYDHDDGVFFGNLVDGVMNHVARRQTGRHCCSFSH